MGKYYTMEQAREVALRTVLSILRENGQDPTQVTADDALLVLDDLCRSEPQLVASYWYGKASERQFRLFGKEWNARISN